MTQHAYSVHPGQMRRAMSALAAQGADIDGYGRAANGMVVIVVNLPDNVPAPDWQRQPPAPHRPASIGAAQLQVAAVISVLGAVAYVAYVALGGIAAVPASVPGQLRQTLAIVMDNIGVALIVLLFAISVWIARPLVAKVMSAGGRK